MDGVAAFWQWWPTVCETLEEAMDRNGQGVSLDIDAITERVHQIGSTLDWELGPGAVRPYAFCLSGNGDPALRLLAERWRRNAPDQDSWEFHAARLAKPQPESHVLQVGEHAVSFGEFRLGIEQDEVRERVNLEFHHPLFAEVPQDYVSTLIFLSLDATLGEDGVERWVGEVNLAGEAPPDAVGLSGLRDAVDALADMAEGQRWSLLSGTVEGHPIVIVANMAVKRWDYPLFSTHGQVRIPLSSPQEDGLPSPEESELLDSLEDGLLAALGEQAVCVGRETTNGLRTVHLYTDGQGPVPDAVRRWAESASRAVNVEWTEDPAWRTYRRW